MPDRHTMDPEQLARLVQAAGGTDAVAAMLGTTPEKVQEVLSGERPITEMEFCRLMIRAAARRTPSE